VRYSFTRHIYVIVIVLEEATFDMEQYKRDAAARKASGEDQSLDDLYDQGTSGRMGNGWRRRQAYDMEVRGLHSNGGDGKGDGGFVYGYNDWGVRYTGTTAKTIKKASSNSGGGAGGGGKKNNKSNKMPMPVWKKPAARTTGSPSSTAAPSGPPVKKDYQQLPGGWVESTEAKLVNFDDDDIVA
jgi:hypothetical protein